MHLHDSSQIFAVAAFIEFLEQNLGYDIFLFEKEAEREKGPEAESVSRGLGNEKGKSAGGRLGADTRK